MFLQLIDPVAFGGGDAFTAETGHFAELCRSAQPLDADAPVRMPGDRAQRMWDEQSVEGVRLHPEIMARMAPLLEKYGIAAPTAR